MSTDQDQLPTLEGQTPSVSPGNYSPVTVHVHDTLGALFLGIFGGILLIGWMRAEARNRALTSQLERTMTDHLPNVR